MTEWGKCYLQNVSQKCNFQQSETLDFQNFLGSMPPDPPSKTKILVHRFAAFPNFCILLGTHSQFDLDPRLAIFKKFELAPKTAEQFSVRVCSFITGGYKIFLCDAQKTVRNKRTCLKVT